MALQAVGSFSMYSGHFTGMVVIGFSGHIRLMVSKGAESGVMSIHTLGVICVGRGIVVVLHSCRKQFDSILAVLLM